MQVTLENIQLYAYHGCLEEEALIGQNYRVDVYITTDYTEAAQTDDLTKTVDYTQVYEIVKREMAIRSKLIEHVCRRICEALTAEIPTIEKCQVKLTKYNPPVNGMVGNATVTWEGIR